VCEVLRAPYVRYVDDFALFHDDPAVLADWQGRIDRTLVGRRLKLHPKKTVILPTAWPAAFLGFELMAGPQRHPARGRRGYRRLPADNVARFRGRLRALRDRWRARTVGIREVEAKLGAWIAHARNGDSFRLRQAIFADGRFAGAG
jgi:hypothetical protein